jgi:xanthine/uracil/vitamin C permease (AzgA family)
MGGFARYPIALAPGLGRRCYLTVKLRLTGVAAA